MMEKITPNENTARLGIFWFIGEGHKSLLSDAIPVNAGQDYGDYLIYENGHYEFWEKLKNAKGANGVDNNAMWVIKNAEYEQFPRGRVAFNKANRKFVIYIDRVLYSKFYLEKIIASFCLTDKNIEVRFDEHYQYQTFVLN